MSTGHELELTIEIGGVQTEIVAVFDIDAFSTSDDYWTGGGSGVDTVVQSVYYADDTEQARDIRPMLETMRDLELRYIRTYPEARERRLKGDYSLGPGVNTLAYGYGFNAYEYPVRLNNNYPHSRFWLNHGRTLADTVEMLVNQHVSENEIDYYPEPDYDYVYQPDMRGEYDV